MEATRSLDTAEAGETITVRRILFDGLRSHCLARGVHEGARLRVGLRDAQRVQLQMAGGRAVPCERQYARFIQVASAAAEESRANAAAGREDADGGTRS